MTKDKEIIVSNVITGYYHGIYYYLVVVNPFNYHIDVMLKTIKKFDRSVKLLAPIPDKTIQFFKEYMLQNYGITEYFINPYTYKVTVYSKDKINLNKIFEDTGYYCQVKKLLSSSISATIENLYHKNYETIYELKKRCYYGLNSKESEYFLFTPLGGGNEIGRSCYLFKTENSKFLVDIGMGFKKNTRVPQFSAYISDFNELSGIFITHPHLDHVGNIIELIKLGYKGPIYMTYACLKLTYISLLDCLKLYKQNLQTPNFTIADVDELTKYIIIIKYNQKITLSCDVSIYAKYSCHILGGCMLEINVKNKTYLFTSDFNSLTPGVELLKPFKLKKEYELIISEGTNLSKVSNYSLLEPKLIESIQHIKSKQSLLLMPCLLYGRGHEIIYNLIKLFIKYPQLEVPLYISKSIYEIGLIYTEHIDELSSEGIKFISSNLIDKYTQIIKKGDETKILESSGIIIAPSGMLEGGSAVRWLLKIVENPDHICLLSCYQPSNTLGYEIQNSINSIINIICDNEEHKRIVKCKIGTISPYFGAHITKDKLTPVLALSKKVPIIIHTSINLKSEVLQKERYVIVKNLETYRII